ncbi:phage tail assembly protein T [Streptomyces roseolus]
MTEWMAYERITGPLGPTRGDVLHGIRAAVTANTVAARGRKTSPRDFIPEWDHRPASTDDMLSAARTVTALLGGTDHTTGGSSDDAG